MRCFQLKKYPIKQHTTLLPSYTPSNMHVILSKAAGDYDTEEMGWGAEYYIHQHSLAMTDWRCGGPSCLMTTASAEWMWDCGWCSLSVHPGRLVED